MTDKIKNYLILGLLALLLISGGLNIYQNKIRKNSEIAAELARANSNTLIAAKTSEVEQKQAAIESIRKERGIDSLKKASEIGALKGQISTFRKKLESLPKVIVYNPDSATVDSLRVAFSLKDSTINTQALMITSMEVEKEGYFKSFHREIGELEGQKSAQVVAINQLQTQLVDEQGKVRKEKRNKKIWRFLAGVGIATAGVLAVMSQ